MRFTTRILKLIFHSLKKSTYLLSKGLLWLYVKKKKLKKYMIACSYGTSLLVFNSIPRNYYNLYSLARYLTRSLTSLMR